MVNKKTKVPVVDLHAAKMAELERHGADAQERKIKARRLARRERAAADKSADLSEATATDQVVNAPGTALGELVERINAGQAVTASQVTAARGRDELAALQQAAAAERAEQDARARQERVVQVALETRDTWQIVRADVQERATEALQQVVLQLDAELRAAYAPVQTANREMRNAKVSPYVLDNVEVRSYQLSVDIEDTVERSVSAILRRIAYSK